jgi:phage shock protein PspC (stress-responsive transcriptional regulator)
MERTRRRTTAVDDFDTSLMYDDIEKIRDREQEEEKDQKSKLGSAGMMAFIAGAALMALGVLGGGLGLTGEFWTFLVEGALPVIGIGALGYGFIKMLRMAFREKQLNFPVLNVYRKKAATASMGEEVSAPITGQRYQQRQQYQQRSRGRQAGTNSKLLKRSRTNKVFSGVAGGLAEYMGISPALIRFAFIATIPITSGMSIFAYLLLSIVLPANFEKQQAE